MFTEDEIQKQLAQVIKKIKAKKTTFGKEEKLIAFNSIYIESVKLYNRIAVHAEGVFPAELFEKKSPNETKEEFDWRKDIYKERTMSYWARALGMITRLWNPNNFTIAEFASDRGAYFLSEYPDYNSIISFFKFIVTDWKLKDPNGVLAVKPRRIPTKLDTAGNLKNDDTKLIEPIGVVYRSESLISYDETHALVRLDEKSLVKVSKKLVKEGLIFEFYDDENIWRIIQFGKKEDFTFEFELYYPHKLGYLPVWKLRGKALQRATEPLYHSYFMPAVPNLDAAACNYSNLDQSIYLHVFPQKWTIVEDCNVPDCVDGQVTLAGGKSISCLTCEGKGKVSTSTTGVIELKLGDKFSEGAKDAPIPPFGYESPKPDILSFLKDTINEDLQDAFLLLNINVSTSNVKGSETALGKQIDREELFSFLSTIADELFDLLKNTIKAIGEMRWKGFKTPQINPPVTFEIRSERELIEEINKARESKLPLPAFRLLLKEWLRKRFNNNQEIEDKINLVFELDTLATNTDQEITMKLNSKEILLWEAVLHRNIFRYMAENEKVTKEKLIELAQADALLLPTSNILERANAEGIS